jgi:hypothetical protein
MINPQYNTQPKYSSTQLSDTDLPSVTVVDNSDEYYRQISSELEQSAQSLLDWHPLPEDPGYKRVAAVNSGAMTYKLAERTDGGLAVWSVADDQPPHLVLSIDPNQHQILLDPDLAKDATQTFRAAAIAETMGVYLRSTQLKVWESPSKDYQIQSEFDARGDISNLQVSAKSDDRYEPILVVQDNQILLNHLTQDDSDRFRRFGKHMRSQLLQQQYATTIQTNVQFSGQPTIQRESKLER